ncbi:MAG: hypothetical protein OIF58_16990, partial [Cohaesibacter sp.]|nr:hypothetical protein [Cohaesibacter sp.]
PCAFPSSSTIELSDLMQVEESIVVVEVVSVSTDVGWVVIPYYYYDFKQTKATQILLLVAFKSAFLTTKRGNPFNLIWEPCPLPPHPLGNGTPMFHDTIKDKLMSENMGYQNP